MSEYLSCRGNKITYAYDGGRMVGQTWYATDGSVANTLAYTYDADGNLLTASSNAGTYTFTYDAGRLLTQTDPNGLTLTYGYDEEGNVTSITDSLGGQTTKTYDGGRLVSETYASGGTQLRIDTTYDADGNVLSATRYADLAGTTEVGRTTYLRRRPSHLDHPHRRRRRDAGLLRLHLRRRQPTDLGDGRWRDDALQLRRDEPIDAGGTERLHLRHQPFQGE